MALFTDTEIARLKVRWDNEYEQDVFADAPTAGLCAHEEMGGQSLRVPVKFGTAPGGSGARLPADVSGVGGTQAVAFDVQYFTQYAQEVVDNVAALFSESAEDAVVSIYGDAQASCLNQAGRLIEAALHSDGSGCDAVILSHTGTTGTVTFTLTQPSRAYRFQAGETIAAKVTPFAASLATGTVLLTAVDQVRGTLTGTAQGGFDATALDGYSIGNINTVAASTAFQQTPGLPIWLTSDAALLAATFFGVVRAANAVNLAGTVMDLTGTDVLSAIQALVTQICVISGAKPNTIILNFSNYNKLLALTTNQRRYVDVKGGDIDVSYEGFRFQGPKGPLDVVQSPFCDQTEIYALTMEYWKIGCPGGKDPVRVANRGDQGFISLINTDQSLIRMRAAYGFWTNFPGSSGKAIVSA